MEFCYWMCYSLLHLLTLLCSLPRVNQVLLVLLELPVPAVLPWVNAPSLHHRFPFLRKMASAAEPTLFLSWDVTSSERKYQTKSFFFFFLPRLSVWKIAYRSVQGAQRREITLLWCGGIHSRPELNRTEAESEFFFFFRITDDGAD